MTVSLSLGYRRAGGQPCQCLGHQARRRAGRRRELQLGGQGLRRGSARRQRASRRSSANGDAARAAPGCAARINGTTQGVTLLVLRAAIIGFALLLWSAGQASAGDITFVLTSFFVLQGYLRDVGMHIRNLQRSVNDMEELVDIHAQPLGVADRPDAEPIRDRRGRHRVRQRDVPLRQPSDCRSTATSRCDPRRASGSAWSAIRARARRRSSS